MADELDPVTQEFLADVEDFVENVERARDEAAEFAGGCKTAADEADGLRDSAEEAAPALTSVRDQAIEAARALGIYADDAGRFHEEGGRFVSAARLEADGLGWIRDNAAEAAAELRRAKSDTDGVRDAAGEAVPELEAEAAGLRRVRDDAAGAAAGLRQVRSARPSGGGSGGGGGASLGDFAPGLGSPTAVIGLIGAVEAAVMVVGPEVAALATGLTAAGLGVGAFAALAAPAFSKVHTAYTQIQADQQAYDRALTSSQRKTAMEHLKQDWASLDPAQAGAVRGVQQLVGEFHKLSTAFEPTAFKVFDEGLKIANQLMPYVAQFATAAAPAIEQALGGLSKFVGGAEFKTFMDFLSSLSGPVITAVGSGLSGLAQRLMGLMELFSKKDVINSVNIAFRLLGFAVQLTEGLIMEGMDAWDLLTAGLHNTAAWFDRARHAAADFAHDMAAHFDEVRHDVATWAHDMAHGFDDVRHGVAELAHDIATWFDRIRHDIASWADDVVRFFQQLPGRIVSALGDLGSLLYSAGVNLVAGLWNGISSMAGRLFSYVGNIAHSISSAFTGALGMASPSRVFYQHGVNTFMGWINAARAMAPLMRQAVADVAGHVGAAGASIGAGGGGGYGTPSPSVHVNMPVTMQGTAQVYNTPEFMQYLQMVVQEAILRYGLNNSTNGLALPGRQF